MHWVIQDENVTNAMSVQYDFQHPSDTSQSGNPVDRIACREEGFVDTGKFHEHLLRRSRESTAVKFEMDHMGDSVRM